MVENVGSLIRLLMLIFLCRRCWELEWVWACRVRVVTCVGVEDCGCWCCPSLTFR